MEAVAPGDDIAAQFPPNTTVHERNRRCGTVETIERDVVDLEVQRRARVHPRGDQILNQLVLAIDRDIPPAQFAERDPVPLTLEQQL